MKPIRSNRVNPSQYGNVIMKGWLLKWAGRLKTWKKRWFVLTDLYLLYYLTPGKPAKGEISLNAAQVQVVQEPGREFTFSLFPPLGHREMMPQSPFFNAHPHEASAPNSSSSNGTPELEGSLPYNLPALCRMAAGSVDERDAWVKEIQLAVKNLSRQASTSGASLHTTASNFSLLQKFNTGNADIHRL
ncbi:Cytohesin-1 [Cichlidogyrus casuarinus]|uniref:Cytohesin-1 n=1 Tax=Cichlidogyrus casuarinus TaxID=1844966 RepID=A0ABD2Q699_9PLAT